MDLVFFNYFFFSVMTLEHSSSFIRESHPSLKKPILFVMQKFEGVSLYNRNMISLTIILNSHA